MARLLMLGDSDNVIGRAKINARLIDMDDRIVPVLALSCLFVAPEHRLSGIGQAFLAFCESAAVTSNLSFALGWTEDENIKFYEHCGWLTREIKENRHIVWKQTGDEELGQDVKAVGDEW